MKSLFFFLFLLPTVGFSQFEGVWHSNFIVLGQSMQMSLILETQPELSAQLKNPKQESLIPCDVVTIVDSTIHFEWTAGGLKYTGKFTKDSSIVGNMTQSGIEWEANFSRQKLTLQKISRPQEPQAPFSYASNEYLIPNGDIVIGATLTIPAGFNEKTPIVILASGSGPQNRNCEIMGHQPFWVIADHLAKNQIACLRFDDRGVGESTGKFQEASLEDFASDVAACAKFLRKELGYKKNEMGIAGHSEGGMHALMAAQKNKKIDFIIELASIGTSGYATLVRQQYLIPKAEGSEEDLCKWNSKTFAEMGRIVLHVDPKIAQDSLTKVLGNQYDNAPESFDKSSTSRAQFIMGNILFLNNEWGRQFLAFEAREYLEKLKLPILTINGSKDTQVPPMANAEAFRQYENCEVHLLEGLNHLLQHSETGRVMEYAEIDETISPEVLTIMTDWIQNL